MINREKAESIMDILHRNRFAVNVAALFDLGDGSHHCEMTIKVGKMTYIVKCEHVQERVILISRNGFHLDFHSPSSQKLLFCVRVDGEKTEWTAPYSLEPMIYRLRSDNQMQAMLHISELADQFLPLIKEGSKP